MGRCARIEWGGTDNKGDAIVLHLACKQAGMGMHPGTLTKNSDFYFI